MKRSIFPFSAIVGQEAMKTALLLNAVDPTIGGVLVSGHKGTGKSTAVRALAQILPEIQSVADCPFHCPGTDPTTMCDACHERFTQDGALPTAARSMPLVELPLSATEDRVVGTLHMAHALNSGEIRFDPGLLAAANRGILYVDEVNLLDDHLVDILLDAAASGVNVVEREGISHAHPARFLLVGTMNPEEGQLRPQFLDRFGLSLSIKSLADAEMREAVVRCRIAFDENPEAFSAKWTEIQAMLTRQVVGARKALADIRLSKSVLTLAVRLATEAGAHGHRPEIVMIKTARALAAMLEAPEVTPEHLAEAARLVLPHRMTHMAIATPEALSKELEGILSKVMGGNGDAEDADDDGTTSAVDEDWDEISTQVPGNWAASNTDMLFSYFEEKKKLFLTPMN